jgi:hypothetical protein
MECNDWEIASNPDGLMAPIEHFEYQDGIPPPKSGGRKDSVTVLHLYDITPIFIE